MITRDGSLTASAIERVRGRCRVSPALESRDLVLESSDLPAILLLIARFALEPRLRRVARLMRRLGELAHDGHRGL